MEKFLNLLFSTVQGWVLIVFFIIIVTIFAMFFLKGCFIFEIDEKGKKRLVPIKKSKKQNKNLSNEAKYIVDEIVNSEVETFIIKRDSLKKKYKSIKDTEDKAAIKNSINSLLLKYSDLGLKDDDNFNTNYTLFDLYLERDLNNIILEKLNTLHDKAGLKECSEIELNSYVESKVREIIDEMKIKLKEYKLVVSSSKPIEKIFDDSSKQLLSNLQMTIRSFTDNSKQYQEEEKKLIEERNRSIEVQIRKLSGGGEEDFRHVADSLGIKVSSVAMSGFFAQNLITRNNYRDLITDCFRTMYYMNATVAFLPLGGCGTAWQTRGIQRDSLVNRLHTIGEMALQQGYTVGIRTSVSAKEDIRLLNEVKSEGIKIYYNFQDAADAHRDICKELKQLGAKRIIQIHASNTDSVNLREDPDINLPKIKQTLDGMNWKGWLVIERSRDVKRVKEVKYNFSRNVAFLKEIYN